MKLEENIYVLNSFQKKSTIGIKTPKPDQDPPAQDKAGTR